MDEGEGKKEIPPIIVDDKRGWNLQILMCLNLARDPWAQRAVYLSHHNIYSFHSFIFASLTSQSYAFTRDLSKHNGHLLCNVVP